MLIPPWILMPALFKSLVFSLWYALASPTTSSVCVCVCKFSWLIAYFIVFGFQKQESRSSFIDFGLNTSSLLRDQVSNFVIFSN